MNRPLDDQAQVHYAVSTLTTWVSASLTANEMVDTLLGHEAHAQGVASLTLDRGYFFAVARWQIVGAGVSDDAQARAIAQLKENVPEPPAEFTEPQYAWEQVFRYALDDYNARAHSDAGDVEPMPSRFYRYE